MFGAYEFDVRLSSAIQLFFVKFVKTKVSFFYLYN